MASRAVVSLRRAAAAAPGRNGMLTCYFGSGVRHGPDEAAALIRSGASVCGPTTNHAVVSLIQATVTAPPNWCTDLRHRIRHRSRIRRNRGPNKEWHAEMQISDGEAMTTLIWERRPKAYGQVDIKTPAQRVERISDLVVWTRRLES